MKHYNIIILGGGIAGLYTAYKLQNAHKSIALIEKNDRLGGRIYTYYNKSKGIQIEGGAGRINYKHKLFNKLLNDLHLQHTKLPIPNTFKYIDKHGNDLTDKKNKYIKKLYKFIIKYDIEKHKHSLNRCYLVEFLKLHFDKDYVRDLEDMFEYKSLMYKLNCYEFFKIFKKDYHKHNKYFILKKGLGEVIRKLKSNTNIKYYLNTLIHTITYKDSTYILNDSYSCDQLVCALPKDALTQFSILNKFKKELNSINEIPLARIYEKYKDKRHPVLQLTKTVTNNRLQYIIPISDHVVMSSYSDIKNANYWKKKQIKGDLQSTLHTQLVQFIGQPIDNPEFTKLFYWKNGVGSWKKEVNTDEVSKKILNMLPNFYICGENYSQYQAWCEGALMTSEKVIKLINKKKRGGRKTRKKHKKHRVYTAHEVKKHNKKRDAWIIIDKKVYDITKWIDKHPGGDIILKWIGKDGTDQFNSIHPSYVKKKILPTYFIGYLTNPKTKKKNV